MGRGGAATPRRNQIHSHFHFHMAYAVFSTGGKQYRVSQGDVISVEKLEGESGGKTTFSDVLMVADGGVVRTGAEVKGASVQAEIVSQYKGEKVIAYKYRRRKGYHRTVGHRRRLTKLKITGIAG